MNLENQERLEMMECKVMRVLREDQAILELRASRALRVNKVRLEKMEMMVHLETKDLRVPKEHLEGMVIKESLEQKAQEVRLVMMEVMENQDFKEQRDLLDHLENLVLGETLESLVILVLSRVRKDQQEMMEHRETRVHQGRQAKTDSLVTKDLTVSPVSREIGDLQEIGEIKDRRDSMVELTK